MLYFMFQQNSSDTTAMFHSKKEHIDVNSKIMRNHYTQVKIWFCMDIKVSVQTCNKISTIFNNIFMAKTKEEIHECYSMMQIR